MNELEELLRKHLQSNSCYDSVKWTIKHSSLGGRGLFANCDIQPGEIIFTDNPLIIGPRVGRVCPTLCVSCYKTSNLEACLGGCGLPVCSEFCATSNTHKKECEFVTSRSTEEVFSGLKIPLLKCLTPIRSLFLTYEQKKLLHFLIGHQGPQHGIEVDILKKQLNFKFSNEEESLMRLTCAILDANSFEVITGNGDNVSGLRGLYPLSSLMNHSCVPNTMHNFDRNQLMIVKATVLIPKDQEIFHSYTRLIWGTAVRQSHLASTKHFLCKCLRCMDPTEFGTNLSAINCLNCKGYVLPLFRNRTLVWICTVCNKVMPPTKVGVIMSVLGCCLKEVEKSDVEDTLQFLNGKLLDHIPSCSQIAMELKYKLVWVLGNHEQYLLTDLTMELLQEKKKICMELLDLLSTLGAGQNKMRGLLLYELYCCLKEFQRRNNKENVILNEDIFANMDQLFDEARIILMNDVHAPTEIKEYNQKIAENLGV